MGGSESMEYYCRFDLGRCKFGSFDLSNPGEEHLFFSIIDI